MYLTGQDFRRLAGFRFSRRGGVTHAHVTDHPIRQRAGQPKTFPAERQIRCRVTASGQTRDANDLKAAVQHERMDVQPVPT